MDTEINISLSVYYTDTIKLFLFFLDTVKWSENKL